MTFVTSFPGPINGTIQCTTVGIADDNVFEGDKQDFTVEISSVEQSSGLSNSVKCIADCNATITLLDNAADCECVLCCCVTTKYVLLMKYFPHYHRCNCCPC